MDSSTQKLSVIAYYLSKYSGEAAVALGYTTQQSALTKLSALFGHPNAYLKLRRDEFDVVTGSHRKGFRNRPPAVSVSNLAALLDNYTFEELTDMVVDMINIQKNDSSDNSDIATLPEESTLEDLLNGYISDAKLVTTIGKRYQRVCNGQSLNKLKQYYNHCCQICGRDEGAEFGTHLAEIHHIIPFVMAQDNSITNLVVLCPTHHRLLHKLKAVFNAENSCFSLSDGREIPLKLNHHL